MQSALLHQCVRDQQLGAGLILWNGQWWRGGLCATRETPVGNSQLEPQSNDSYNSEAQSQHLECYWHG